MKNPRHGFTLIELLVVIAIIAVLSTILLPSLVMAKELARNATCINQLRHCGTSYALYAHDYNGQLPQFVLVRHYEAIRRFSYFGNAAYRRDNLVAFFKHEGIYNEYLEDYSVFYCPVDPVYTDKQDIYFNSLNTPRWSYLAYLGQETMNLTADHIMQRDRDGLVHLDNRKNYLYGDTHVDSEQD